MGLDMYLYKKIYIGANYEFKKITGGVALSADGHRIPINDDKIVYIEESAGYWRKANAIHKWFVDNVQDGEDDCGEYEVEEEQLKELLQLVNQVLETPQENFADIARVLLPAQEGFFFGSTDYDEGYIEDLKITKEIIEKIFQDKEKDPMPPGVYVSFIYSSSW